MYKSEKKIWIYADWDFLEAPQLIGQLTAQHIRGKEVFSFEYQDTWLKAKKRSHLDPNLLLYAGKQFLREEKQNFGLFSDSAPDRWGRMLIQRREAIHARAEKRSPNPLFESDYLLGVFDAQRMGGIRLKTEQLGPFQNADQAFAVPPLKTLSTLQYAAWQIESDSTGTETEQQKWLNTLLAPGASIGGARLKQA